MRSRRTRGCPTASSTYTVRTLALLIAVSALLAGCAARRPSPAVLAELGRAQTLVNEGCYRCLLEALATYQRLAAAPNGPPDARRGAFEAAVLLLMRSKELGLPEPPALTRAKEHAAQVPISPSTLPPDAYLDAIALITSESAGHDPEEREQRGRTRRGLWPNDGSVPAARVRLAAAAPGDVVAQYVALALDCDDPRLRKEVPYGDILARYPVPLMRFRVALCGLGQERVDAVREADPRWTDTLFFEGRREMLSLPAPDLARAAALLADAHGAFPDSRAVVMSLGNVRNMLSEHERALALFDSILAESPDHRDALMGRVLSLSYLSRHADAAAAATRMIDLGTWHVGDALYWRAWNRYHLYQLDAAWDDIERATKLNVTSSVYTLAGVIAYARKELDVAIARLDRAYRLDQTNCEASWTEGLVHVDKAAFAPGGERFARATACFTATVDDSRRELAAIDEATLAEAVKERRRAAARKRLDAADHRRAQSAFNAASCYARLARKDDAARYAAIAAGHPLMKEKAAALQIAIDKLPS